MKIFVTSDLPCHFKINGNYFGVIDKNLTEFEIEGSPLFEALPLSDNFLPCYSGIEGNKSIRVFKVLGGLLVYPVLRKSYNLGFKMLGQTETVINGVKTVLTAVLDGAPKFYLDGIISDVKPLPFCPENIDLHYENGLIFASFSKEKCALFVYSLESSGLVFSSVVNAFSIGETLTVKKEYKTVLKTRVIEKWNLSKECSLVEVKSESQKTFFDINEKLVPTAFFESVVIGASVNEIASPSLVKRYDSLREFLGKVIRVIPSPSEEDCVWLVLDNKVTKGIAVFESGLITNVLLDDF